MGHVDVKPAPVRFPNQHKPKETKNKTSTSDDLKAASPSDQVDKDNCQRRERLPDVDAKVIYRVREGSSLWREIVSYETVSWGTTAALEETQAEPGDEDDPD